MIYAFIIVTFILLIVIEIFTVLFRMTGLSERRSRFQVISMLTGVGYTTKESESIVTNNTRRSLAQIIILLGYTSSVTLITIFVNFFTHRVSVKETYTVVAYCVVLLILVRLKFIKIAFDKFIERIADYYMYKSRRNKLHTISHYNENILAELTILHEISILNKHLSEINMNQNYNIQILNIERSGVNISNPAGKDVVQLNDKVLVFGGAKNIRHIFKSY